MASSDRKELKAQWKTDVKVPVIKAEDVAKHNTKTDLWMTIHGKAYDLTSYAKVDHPGGFDALFEVAGKDATSAFEDVGHSEDAREIMHKYLVGVIEGAQEDNSAKKAAVQSAVETVRRGQANAPSKSKLMLMEDGKLTLQGEVAIGCFGGMVLLWTIWASGLLSHLHAMMNFSHGSHEQAFSTGFMSAAVAASGLGYVAYHRLSKATQFETFYRKYPAHVHQKAAVLSTNRPAGVLIPQEYQAFPLVHREKLSADSYRLVFELPTKYAVLGLPTGQHVAIRGGFDDEDGHHTVTRSYTPVSNNKDLGRLELVIKMYSDGQLTGKYLSKLQIGDKVEFRGPKGAMRYRKDMCRRLGMIAGGTGITPMYQLIRAICEDKTDSTVVSLIYANKTEADILLKKQLDEFQKMAPEKFKVTYVLDKPVPGWKGEVGYVDKKMIQALLPTADADSKILLCGPPGMVNASKKNLVSLGFEEPGSVSKMSDQVFMF